MNRLGIAFGALTAIALVILVANTTGLDRGLSTAIDGSIVFEHLILDDAPPAKTRINDLQVGDLDGDGWNDVWTTGRGGGADAHQMVWYRGPDWSRRAIAPGDFKYGCLADIDADGDLDAVAGCDNDARVYWFENADRAGTGDWTRHDPSIEGKPDMIHAGDLNGDGRIDLVCMGKDRLRWAKNPGVPGPWMQTEIWAGRRRTGGKVADIDADGDLDVLYGNAWFENTGAPGREGWPRHTIDSRWPAQARGDVGDLDGDGLPDVVLSGEESAHGVAWYRSTDGGLTWTGRRIAGESFQKVHSLRIGDFDRDGRPDLFAAEMHTSIDRRVVVFLNPGAGGREPWPAYRIADTGSHNAAIADLNGDGWLDIVGKNYEAGEIPLRVDLWINRTGEDSAGRSPDRWRRIVIGRFPHQALFVVPGDLDGDGLPELVTGAWIYHNPGSVDGAWARSEIGPPFANLALVDDLDGDGDLDLLGTDGKPEGAGLVLAENMGSGRFRIHDRLALGAGDFLQGACVVSIGGGENSAVALSWHRAERTELLRIPERRIETLSTLTNNEGLAVGDFDGDGDDDIHLGTAWLEQLPDNAWQAHEALALSVRDADPDRVEAGDIDGDGDLDAVVGCEHAALLIWAENPGEGRSPWIEHRIAADGLHQSLDLGDLDGDGDLDVVSGLHKGAGEVFIYLNQDGGSSWSRSTVDPGDGAVDHHEGTRFADLDGDGDLDIVSIGWTIPVLTLYENPGGHGSTPE